MADHLPRTKMAKTKATLLLSLFAAFCILMSCTDGVPNRSALCAWLLPLVGVALTASLVIVAARATIIAWITVLVLLAFSGKRRRVLVRHGRKITTDVAVHLVRLFLKERGLLAVVCATIVSLMAVVRITEAQMTPFALPFLLL